MPNCLTNREEDPVDGETVYKCDCAKYCFNRQPVGPKQVSFATFKRHARFRDSTSLAEVYVVDSKVPGGKVYKSLRKTRRDPRRPRPRSATPPNRRCPNPDAPLSRSQSPTAGPSSGAYTQHDHSHDHEPGVCTPGAPHVDDADASNESNASNASDAHSEHMEDDADRDVLMQENEEEEDDCDLLTHEVSPSPPSRAPSPARMDPEPSPRASPIPRPTVEEVPDEGEPYARRVPPGPDEDEEEAAAGNGSLPFDDSPEFRSEPYLPEAPTPQARLLELRIAQRFIEGLENATLDNDFIDEKTLERLRHPPEGALDLDNDHILRFSLDIYCALDNASDEQYDRFSAICARRQNITLLSFDQVRARAVELSGVIPIYIDMCPNTCHAYTGSYADDLSCTICGEDRYEMRYTSASSRSKKRVSRRRFLTLPVGPQVQALYRDKASAQSMRYRRNATEKMIVDMQKPGFTELSALEDYIHGTEYLAAVRRGDITDRSLVLLLSIDGAQLYSMKESDCWIYIWVVLEHAPEARYKKKHILIGGVIPGPKKPQNLDSFLYPGLHHLSAIMRDGLPVWDAIEEAVVDKDPYLAYGTADGPGMSCLNGCVGHKGAHGCRLLCPQKSHLHGNSYYPACNIPDNYNIPGSCHPDIDLRAEPDPDAPSLSERYHANLHTLLRAQTVAEHGRIRLATGIVKPSIFSGLPKSRIFPIPGCFPADIMHLISLNMPELFFKLWRGTMSCDRKTDDKSTWDWAVLVGSHWETHGQAIGETRQYLPGSFDRPPRNPAEKINSGYKAAEFLTYLYCLGPGMFKHAFEEKYWLNWCKLVRGVRLLHQRSITPEQIQEAYLCLIEFCEEYEELYYQRNPGRLHFCRQSIHALIHMAPETVRCGPYVIFSQWTMERVIGDLTAEIRQPSEPYANLAARAARRAQVNALRVICPDLVYEKNTRPQGSLDLGEGYTLLRAAERSGTVVPPCEAEALRAFKVRNPEFPFSDRWYARPTVPRWARLALPTGQIARCHWIESRRTGPTRKACNVKFRYKLASGKEAYSFAEVQYYFKIAFEGYNFAFAMIREYGPEDKDLLKTTFKTLHSCRLTETRLVINATDIVAVVAAVPMVQPDGRLGPYDGQVFIVEKIGLDVMVLCERPANEEDEEDRRQQDEFSRRDGPRAV